MDCTGYEVGHSAEALVEACSRFAEGPVSVLVVEPEEEFGEGVGDVPGGMIVEVGSSG